MNSAEIFAYRSENAPNFPCGAKIVENYVIYYLKASRCIISKRTYTIWRNWRPPGPGAFSEFRGPSCDFVGLRNTEQNCDSVIFLKFGGGDVTLLSGGPLRKIVRAGPRSDQVSPLKRIHTFPYTNLPSALGTNKTKVNAHTAVKVYRANLYTTHEITCRPWCRVAQSAA